MTNLNELASPDTELKNQKTGEMYRFNALNFKQISEYALWYQYKDYTDAKKIGITDKELLRDIYNSCRNKPYTYESPELIHSMLTPEGLQKIIYIGIRDNHPGFKEEQVGDIIDVMNLEDIALDVMRQTGYSSSSPESDSGENKEGE
jgi:hypothetical protein